MALSYISPSSLQKFITSALVEDIGESDHTTLGAVPERVQASARLLVKADGIIAGLELTKAIFYHIDPKLKITFFKKDGDEIREGDEAFIVQGSARSILHAERLVLNCLQRMSGIATYTRKLCKMIDGTNTRVMDTRKTTPNFRMMEKWAVTIGGGMNHRLALYDMIMIKDNHVDLAGGIKNAIDNTEKYLKEIKKNLSIEIETRSLEEVDQVLERGGVDIIMLDNMSIENMKEAVHKIRGRYKIEASGGITEANLRAVAECGVDYISVGALTHSVKSLDLSLKVIASQ